jgi:hypothetical protein
MHNMIYFNLCMKQGSLFCFVTMKSTKLGGLKLCSWYVWKSLDKEGCIILVHDIWTCSVKVLEY